MATENQLKTLSRKRQSPIDLRDDVARLKYLPPLTLIGHWLNDGEATLTNNGDHAVIELSGERIPSIVKCGPLNDEYEFHNAHFHWAEDDCCGSEHTINSTWFSMEAHVVHWNRKYRTFDECLKHADGLCILAYLFMVKDGKYCRSHSMLEKITDNLEDVVSFGATTKIPANSLCWMREAVRCDYYYFYHGSYNKGDFPECALWIVFPNVMSIRSDQVAEFRKLQDAKGREIKSNGRKLQLLGDRRIYKVFPCCE
ncbi:carbonic anhydrase 1-like isoform X2 [Nasonia vitripennis]|uniref:Carbonic anhydrase n=1 Tax=Nasonia vitripennis TaxID=7425 RepID=A0A7M7H2D4_NASVI|nr:carbonic anhydrase 1-like isoform X2 [Nasonia vitripennis]XP_032451818.1 carbonic anhydrase 1-like isoform X2 [Nasonia vitripennis]